MKKLFIFLLALMFILPFVSSELLTFDNVKTYDSVAREVTIKNTFGLGGDIGKARLNTPLNYHVAPGYQKVAEFDIVSYNDYSNFLKSIDFYDKNKVDWENNKIERTFDLKYKTYEEVLIDDYETKCSNVISEKSFNKTQICEQIKVGSHYEEREVWKELSSKDLEQNKYLTIGIFTDVQVGDKVEWIPTMFGARIIEFAEWTADLNVGLISYYKLDETSGAVVDSVGTFNGVNYGATTNVAGIIATAYNFSSTNIVNVSNFVFGSSGSVFGWLKMTSTENQEIILGTGANHVDCQIFSNSVYCSMGGSFINSGALSAGTWYNIVFTWDGTTQRLYVNGLNVANLTEASTTTLTPATLNLGNTVDRNNAIRGVLDEVGVWSRALTPTEVVQLYNSGDGITYTTIFNSPPNITLNSPSSANYTSPQNIIVNFTASDDIKLSDVKLYVNGVLNQTNASGINNSIYIFNLGLNDGDYTIYGKATDNDSQETNSASIRIVINSTPYIAFITPPTLVNYANITQEYIPMKVNVSTSVFKNITYYLENVNGTSFTQYYTTETYDINFTNIPDAHYHYNVTVCTTTNKCNSTETRHVNHDATPPTILINSPTGVYDYLYVGSLLNLNFTSIDNDNNLSSCFWNYNGTNNSIACTNGTLVSVNIFQQFGRNNITVYSNDTFGNIGTNLTSWNYKILEINKSYNPTTIEGSYERFYLYLVEGTAAQVQSVILHYNGQNDTSALYSTGDNVTAMSELYISPLTVDTNKTFYFTVTLTDGTIFNTTSSVQLVRNIGVDNCSVNTYPILYLYLKDEESRTPINGTIQTSLEVINNENYGQVLNFSQETTASSSDVLCSNIQLNTTEFLLNAEIRYNAENHSAEFYHIQRASLTSSPINISLFDLLTEDTTIFKIIYRNQDLIGVEGAILQLQRKYIADDIYEVVEAPITSSDSSGILHIDTNTNKYQITVVKNGEVLGIFLNLAFICQSELTGECTLNLFDKLSPPNIANIVNTEDFEAFIDTSIDNQTITVTYTIPSGVAEDVQVVAIQQDTILGNTTICNTTVISSAGSIECSYSTTIQDSVISLKVYKEGILLAQKSYVVQEDLRSDWGGINYILLVVLVLSLVFMALASPEWIVINAVVTVLIGGGIWLVRGISFVEGLGSVMWLIIGAIILITKMSQQEDR